MSIAPQDVPSAPWWPELLSIKDTLSYAALSERFGLPIHTLRRALELAGETKVNMPRGPKRKSADDPAPPEAPPTDDRAPLDRHRSKVGRMPDAEVAQLAGVSVDEVKVYRREHGIAPFLRPPPGLGTAPRQEPLPSVRVQNGDAESVVLRRRVSTEGSPTETVRRPPSTVEAAQEAPADPLAVYRERLGTIADDVIADEAGVSRGVIGAYRRKLGIPAYDGFRYRTGEARKPAATSASEPTERTKRSAIEPFRDLLGTAPDSEIAAMAGVSSHAVAKYRSRRGIPGYEGRPPPEKAEPVQPPDEHVAAPSESRSRRSSKLDAFLDIIGVLSDAEVASRSGLTSEGVRMYRKRHGIPAGRPAPVAPAPLSVEQPAVVVVEPALEETAAAVAPVQAAPPAAPAPQVAVGPARAFAIVALRGEEAQRFVTVADDITAALANAVAALAARADGPWRVRSVRDLVEALVVPTLAPQPPLPQQAVAPVAAKALPPPAGEATVTGADLFAYRRARGLTQKELGARLGIGQATLSRIEGTATAALPAGVLRAFQSLQAKGGAK
ncbi:MAG: helix-turn-helix domain-containing protein [Myxococcota bacterium]